MQVFGRIIAENIHSQLCNIKMLHNIHSAEYVEMCYNSNLAKNILTVKRKP